MEAAYETVIAGVRLLWRAGALKFTITGAENLPSTGGAVVAINHTGYLDFTFAGLPFYRHKPRRLTRFMAKQEVFDHKVTGPIMRKLRHIPVDRASGAASFDAAVQALKAGELVGVYPEATISRSFELKEFKSGAVRMALEAQAPIIPLILWGPHRMWTKDHPKNLGRKRIPWVIRAGEPLPPRGTTAELDAELRARMTTILHEVQQQYPHPAGTWWVPHRLGGTAPTPQEAKRLDEDELAERARRKAAESA